MYIYTYIYIYIYMYTYWSNCATQHTTTKHQVSVHNSISIEDTFKKRQIASGCAACEIPTACKHLRKHTSIKKYTYGKPTCTDKVSYKPVLCGSWCAICICESIYIYIYMYIYIYVYMYV